MPNFLKVLRACELLNITQIQIRRAMIDPIVAPSPSPRRSTSESVRSARRSRMSHDVSHVPGPQATPVPAFKKENGASRRRKKLAAHTGATQTKSSQVKALTNAFEDLGMNAQDYGSSAASRSGPGSSNLTASSRRRRTNGAATNAVVGSNGFPSQQAPFPLSYSTNHKSPGTFPFPESMMDYDYHIDDDAQNTNGTTASNTTDEDTQVTNYDDLNRLSSRNGQKQQPNLQPSSLERKRRQVDVLPTNFMPARSYDTYENDNATAIVYGDVDGTAGQVTSFDDDETQLTDDLSWMKRAGSSGSRALDGDKGSKETRSGAVASRMSSNEQARSPSGLRSNGQSGGGDKWGLNSEEWKKVNDQVDKPQVKAALGASAAVVLSTATFGPLGVLVGAAAVGVGMGVMQIPEDQRKTMAEQARSGAQQAYESAQLAVDAMGTTCGAAYEESGMAERVDPNLSKLCSDGVEQACADEADTDDTVIGDNIGVASRDSPTRSRSGGGRGSGSARATASSDNRSPGGDQGQTIPKINPLNDANSGSENGLADEGVDEEINAVKRRRRKVACLRKGRIVPGSQIHSLDPSRQPRAWLDVMASIATTREEKDEAMEELLIFIKDKETAFMLLEEGILDSMIYIISCFFRKHASSAHEWQDEMPYQFSSDPDYLHAKLASTCCIALGRAHCAIVHTDGDLLLMSSYSRGTVPLERQLAQMLYEVPHHTSVTAGKALYPTEGIVPIGTNGVFVLTELSLAHAEELAKSIYALTLGKIILSKSSDAAIVPH